MSFLWIAVGVRRPLPRRHWLSATHFVGVYPVDTKTLASISGKADACWIDAWDSPPELGRIYIDKRLAHDIKWARYQHELIHAIHDYLHWRGLPA